jgi:hypothetical protein
MAHSRPSFLVASPGHQSPTLKISANLVNVHANSHCAAGS